jgi:hypothetical protein
VLTYFNNDGIPGQFPTYELDEFSTEK